MSDPTRPESPQPAPESGQPTPPPYSAQQPAYQQPVATLQPAEPVGVPVTIVMSKSNGLAITALVLGIVAFVLAFIPFVNFFGAFVALVGLVLGAVAIFQKGASKALSISGTVISFVAGILSIVMIVAYANAFVHAVDDSLSKSVTSAASGASSTPSAVPKDTNFKFGQTVTYKDGLAITVSAPAPFTPSDESAGATQAANIVFTITIKNGTTKNYDPAVYTTVSSAGTEADTIFDVGDSSLNPPTTTILAGQSVTYKDAYSVADPTKLVMDIEAGFSYDKTTFTN